MNYIDALLIRAAHVVMVLSSVGACCVGSPRVVGWLYLQMMLVSHTLMHTAQMSWHRGGVVVAALPVVDVLTGKLKSYRVQSILVYPVPMSNAVETNNNISS
jgi:hypothetical protein